MAPVTALASANPLSAGPFVEDAELAGDNGLPGDQFGSSVAISGDTAVVGAPNAGGGGGALYVFTNDSGAWQQAAELTSSDEAAGDGFGTAVAVSGSTIVVGAPNHAGGGAAYVFTSSSGTWQQVAELSPADTTSGGYFGGAVGIDEGTIVVGALNHAGADSSSGEGAAYVFDLAADGSWAQGAELFSADGSTGFGESVAVSDGTVVVGEPSFSFSGAEVFNQTSGAWQQTTQLTVPQSEADTGAAVAISGSTIVLGAPHAYGADNEPAEGGAFVFSDASGSWQQTAALTPSDTAEGYVFGAAVAVSNGTVFVGAPGEQVLLDQQAGAVYEFDDSSGAWQQTARLTLPDAGSGDHFGSSVAFADGTMLAGAPGHQVGLNPGQGSVAVFASVSLPLALSTSPPTISGTPDPGQTLTEAHASWTSDPTAYTYQWEQCDASGGGCVPISGAIGESYTVAQGDVGHTIRVQEVASNAAGASAAATSPATAVVPPLPPAEISPPRIVGTTIVGQVLTDAHGAWTNNPTSYEYRWEDCDASGGHCTGIAGAVSQSYALAASDVGHVIELQETAVNAGGPSGPAAAKAALPVRSAPMVTMSAARIRTAGGRASLLASVDPNGLTTSVRFQYGLDPKYFGNPRVLYDSSTPTARIGGDFAAHATGTTTGRLIPNAVYHIRLVASNSAGTTIGPDETFVTARGRRPRMPVLGVSVDLAPVRGFVLTGTPRYTPVTEAVQIPVGSEIHARRGTFRLIVATPGSSGVRTATVTGGVFRVGQTRSGAITLTMVEGGLAGAPTFRGCKGGATLQTVRIATDGLQVTTIGRYSATSASTGAWETIERCDGTVTAALTGTIRIRDLASDHTIAVRAGQGYLVHGARMSRIPGAV